MRGETGTVDCERCSDVVSARLDGEATAAEEAAADAHLRACAPCRQAADRAATVTRRVRIAPAEAGPDLVDAVLARVLGSSAGAAVRIAGCGCDPGCRCGCQDGRACRCERGAA